MRAAAGNMMKSSPLSVLQIHGRAHARSVAVWTAVLLATVLAVLFYSATWRTGDDGRYYVLGVSIAEGAGLVQYENPLRPPEAITPPLYPALIACIVHATDNPVVWVKRIGNALYVLAVLMAVLALMGPNGVSRPGLMGACMGMFAVGVVSFASFIMSDTLFILWVYASLWMSGRTEQGKGISFVAGCCCGLAYLTRTAGMALVAALLFHSLVRKQWKCLLFTGLGLGLILGPWFYRKLFILQVPDAYLSIVEKHAQHFWGTSLWASFPLLVGTEIIRDIPQFLFRVIPAHYLYAAPKVAGTAGFWNAVALGMGGGIALGFLLRMRKWNAVDFFFAFTLLLIAALPGPIYDKYYFFPLLPIAAYYFFHFLAWLRVKCEGPLKWKAAARAIPFAAAGIFCFSLLLDFTAGMVHFVKENPRRPYGPWAPERFLAFHNQYDDAWARVSEAATWVKDNTPTNALLLSRKSDHLFVMSGRQGCRYDIPRNVQCATLMEAVEKFAPERMVLLLEDAFPAGPALNAYGNNREHVLNETVRKVPERWRVVYSTAEPVTRVWAYGGSAASATGE